MFGSGHQRSNELRSAWCRAVVRPALPYFNGSADCISLSGGGAKNVHICGEAYSDYQGFIEGALRSAEDVLESLGLPRHEA